jgi:hypothetical protein
VAQSIVQLAAQGIQVFVATHSLFLLREFEIELEEARARLKSPVPARFFGLHTNEDGVCFDQGDALPDLAVITALEESLGQADRYLALDEPG